ncbi:MAG: DHH family phosphoesterase, partial [Candidatus Limnocylindria bacterium]
MNDVLEMLRSARSVALVSHRDPDADTIGSAVALGLALRTLGKRVSYHCADPVPEQLRFLSETRHYERTAPSSEADVVVALDFGDAARANLDLPTGLPVVNIDHHVSNSGMGDARLVDPTSAATGEVVARVIDALGIPWTREMATAALVAIMTDTGSFQFPNTDARALERAARLRTAGADLQAITYSVFRNKRFETLKLWGIALARLGREAGGQLVWTWLEPGDFAAAGALDEDASGLIEQIARSSGMRVALLFNARPEGAVKVSCRTSASPPSVDAAALM